MYAASRLAVHRLTQRGVPAERVLEFARLLDEACVRVCEGQFLDISFETRTDVTAERYRGMVDKKTGALFAAAAEGAAVIGTDDAELRQTLVRFGADFGQAFQAHDDLLGIWGTTDRTGKVEMNDIAKRKKTLPVVLAFERAAPRARASLVELYGAPAPLPPENVDRIRDILDDLRVRELLEREIGIHRERALHELRSVKQVATTAEEPLRLLESLIEAATGSVSEATATG
jgi:geranylgeranyl diphosphate synthase, type I